MQTSPTLAEAICRDLAIRLPAVKSGTLRIWGDWFGRPMDNVHRLAGCEASGNRLTLIFDGDERLDIWNPVDVVIDTNRFEVGGADRVRWRWYWYGEPQTPVNLRTLDYLKQDTGIRLRSDVDYRPHEQVLIPDGLAAAIL